MELLRVYIYSRCPNLWFCSSIRRMASAVTWEFLSPSPRHILYSGYNVKNLLVVFKGIYDAFLKYWYVKINVCPFWWHKTNTWQETKLYVLYLVWVWFQHSTKKYYRWLFSQSPKVLQWSTRAEITFSNESCCFLLNKFLKLWLKRHTKYILWFHFSLTELEVLFTISFKIECVKPDNLLLYS